MKKANETGRENKARLRRLLTIAVYDPAGKTVEKIKLPAEIFGAKINPQLEAQAVRVFLANQRQGTASTKTRGEVRGSTRKIYRQKGTGRARHGSRYAPLFVGGGVAHGPKPRDFGLKMPKKMKRLALFSALTGKFAEGAIWVIGGLAKIKPKTGQMLKVLKNLKLNPPLLLILPGKVENVERAAQNLERVTITRANLLNTYLVLKNKQILVTMEALTILKKTFLEKDKRPKER